MPAPPTEFDLAMMRRAISLAMRGRGTVEPNPSVGCVIIKDGRVIGEGHTQPFGGPHAEPTALANCTESPVGATAYVTLEPCCHTNKKTPPCVPAVIAAGIRRVVVGTLDPNPAVNGQGIAQLRAAGVEVISPVLEAEAKQLIAPFIARVNFHRPYVTLKWAESSNGRIAAPGNRRQQISNSESMRVMHGLRGRSDAILVGLRTVRSDDPLLTARDPHASRRPLRVVLDTRLEIPLNSQLVMTAAQSPVVVYCSDESIEARREHAASLRALGVETQIVPTEQGRRLSIRAVLADLCSRSITHLMVEPGQRLSRVLMDNNLWDRAWAFRSPNPILADGYGEAPTAPRVDTPPVGELALSGDRLFEYLNGRSDVLFARLPSADFLLAKEAAQNGSD